MTNEIWSVLHVVANHEKRVAQHLAVRSLEHYLPLYQEDSRWTDRTVRLQRPLFPGYLFVRLGAEGKLPALTAPGVLRLLGGGPMGLVPAAEIERIRLALANGYPLRPHPAIACGTAVRVARGIFTGVEGVIAELRRQSKVVIAVAAIGRCYSLEMKIEDLEILPPASGAAPGVRGDAQLSGAWHGDRLPHSLLCRG